MLLHTYGQVPQPEQEPCEEQDSRDVQELCRKQNPQGEYEFRTYLLGTCKSLGLSKLSLMRGYLTIGRISYNELII